MVVSTKRDLRDLPGAPAFPADVPFPGAGEEQGAPALPDMFIAPPQDGQSYTHEEVAPIVGRKVATVTNWIYKEGKLAADGVTRVKLGRLRIPEGRISPGDLCRFMSAVNGQRVAVAWPPAADTAVNGQ